MENSSKIRYRLLSMGLMAASLVCLMMLILKYRYLYDGDCVACDIYEIIATLGKADYFLIVSGLIAFIAAVIVVCKTGRSTTKTEY